MDVYLLLLGSLHPAWGLPLLWPAQDKQGPGTLLAKKMFFHLKDLNSAILDQNWEENGQNGNVSLLNENPFFVFILLAEFLKYLMILKNGLWYLKSYVLFMYFRV